jgi:hypothetical protein
MLPACFSSSWSASFHFAARNENTLHLPGVFLFERLEARQIVPANEHDVESSLLRDPVNRMVRVLRHLQQNARIQPGPVLLPNSGEF